MLDPSGSMFAGVFSFFFVVVVVFIIGVVVFMVVAITRRWAAVRREGMDPMTADVEMMGRLNRSALLAEDRSVEQRLAELDRLAEAGTISDEERAAARARILGEL